MILLRMIDWGEDFDHLTARVIFGRNDLTLSWLIGQPLPPTLVEDVAAHAGRRCPQNRVRRRVRWGGQLPDRWLGQHPDVRADRGNDPTRGSGASRDRRFSEARALVGLADPVYITRTQEVMTTLKSDPRELGGVRGLLSPGACVTRHK